MSKIQEQIKALQIKQKKIEYLSYVADLIKNDTRCVDFADVQKEVVERIEPFLLELMTEIETDAPAEKEEKLELTQDEIKTLKTVVETIKTKKATPESKPSIPQESPYSKESNTPTQPELPQQDKMSFALNNRHLGNKRVQVLNDQNATIYGMVVGLDAPFVVVKTETGPTINVPLNKVVLV